MTAVLLSTAQGDRGRPAWACRFPALRAQPCLSTQRCSSRFVGIRSCSAACGPTQLRWTEGLCTARAVILRARTPAEFGTGQVSHRHGIRATRACRGIWVAPVRHVAPERRGCGRSGGPPHPGRVAHLPGVAGTSSARPPTGRSRTASGHDTSRGGRRPGAIGRVAAPSVTDVARSAGAGGGRRASPHRSCPLGQAERARRCSGPGSAVRTPRTPAGRTTAGRPRRAGR